MTRGALLALALATGCLGPQVSDNVAERELILPAGTAVPSIYDNPDLARRIDENDGVGSTIPLLSGFASGRPVQYWDFGPAPDFAQPLFVLFRRGSDDTLAPVPHPPILEFIPGDPGYSPYWAVFVVEVNSTYAGQVLPSVAALQDAQDEGLVKSPRLMPVEVNCPIVANGVTLDQGGGVSVMAAGDFYWNGRHGFYFDFGAYPLAADSVHVPKTDFYILRREGGEPLSEPARGVDMDGDGDAVDTNNVFARGADDPTFSPFCREVSVTVAARTASIDTSKDQNVADIRSASQLFSGDVPAAPVIAFAPTGRNFNCPIKKGP